MSLLGANDLYINSDSYRIGTFASVDIGNKHLFSLGGVDLRTVCYRFTYTESYNIYIQRSLLLWLLCSFPVIFCP